MKLLEVEGARAPWLATPMGMAGEKELGVAFYSILSVVRFRTLYNNENRNRPTLRKLQAAYLRLYKPKI